MTDDAQPEKQIAAELADRYLDLWFANLAAWAAESELSPELALQNMARDIAGQLAKRMEKGAA